MSQTQPVAAPGVPTPTVTLPAFLLARMREPSTWAAIAALLVAFHAPLAQGVTENITTIGTAIAGLLGVLLGEQTKG